MSIPKRRPLPDALLARAARTLRVLTHVDRLRICQLLLHRACSVNEICTELELKQNVASQHLTQLRAAGIAAPQRKGKQVFYQIIHPAPEWLLECIGRHMRGAARGYYQGGEQ